jgi:hypothetical protein
MVSIPSTCTRRFHRLRQISTDLDTTTLDLTSCDSFAKLSLSHHRLTRPRTSPSTYRTPSLSVRALAGPAKLRTRTTSSPRRFSLSSLLSSAPPAAPPTARSTYTGSAPAAIWLDWPPPRAAGQGGHPDDTKRVSRLLWVSLRVMRAQYGMDRLDECYCMHGGAMREVGELEEGCMRQSAI